VDDNSGAYKEDLKDMSQNLKPVERYLTGYIIGFSVFFLAFPYILYLVANLADFRIVDHWARHIVAMPLLLLGLVFVVWSNIALVRSGKGGPTDLFNVAISPRTRHLVVTGPYEYTRNPMVFGAFSCYVALAIYLNSLSDIILLAFLLVAARFYLEETEERRLWKDFGKEFEEYRRRTPMILPRLYFRRRGRYP
jgi:protein-S-isoprenylcysteine O-methyltransferase Ste14